MRSGAALSVRDVTLRFSGVVALSEVSFDVEPGSVHAVIGPNGAGKSSLFNVLSGLYRPQNGSITMDGVELLCHKPHWIARAGLGRAFQNASMFEDLSVAEHLLIGRHRFGRNGLIAAGLGLPSQRRYERSARAVVDGVAASFGLTEYMDLNASELPYGLQKRVDLARAVATSPKLLLLDEPAAGLHTHEKAEMSAMITQLTSERDLSVLLVEHDMPLVMELADALTVLDFGTVIMSGDPAVVADDERVIAAYLGTTSEAAS